MVQKSSVRHIDAACRPPSIASALVDQEKREMADLAHAFEKNGIRVDGAPIDYQDYHRALLMPTCRETCAAIKMALDPNGVIAPGRYGIGAAIGTSDRKADQS
jgi:hypothetical protein